MKKGKRTICRLITPVVVIAVLTIISAGIAFGGNLSEVKERGVLRHLGVPYANFVTGSGDGMDVEMVRLFARYLGVRYEYVRTSWGEIIGDLTGKKVKPRRDNVDIIGTVPVKGDIIANGFTILPWRQKVIDYGTPSFPTQVWLVVRGDSPIRPINPSGDIEKDIAAVKALLGGRSVIGVAGTCLDPDLYGIKEAGTKITLFQGNLNELAPVLIKGETDAILLDVPDTLIALEKWPGRIKVVGPISPRQEMGCGFARTSPELRDAFNRFFEECRKDGTYLRIVKKYYPDVFYYYPDFFKER
ncbi:MAG: transporter substrate-binding domain-containing protein [Syntrophobacterales bacterium]|nr:transporter substrate-binding domain-containing protein [Syntrophobacterales bacterium]